MSFHEYLGKMPDSEREKIAHKFDNKGNIRRWRELPGGIVVPLSDEEAKEEREALDKTRPTISERNLSTPSILKGAKHLSEAAESGKGNNDTNPETERKYF